MHVLHEFHSKASRCMCISEPSASLAVHVVGIIVGLCCSKRADAKGIQHPYLQY
jgi:hypothetical protein